MEHLDIDSCPIHSVDTRHRCLAICHTCGCAICDECEGHEKHQREVLSISPQEKEETLQPSVISLLSPLVEKRLHETRTRGKNVQDEWEKLRKRLAEDEKLILAGEEGIMEELRLLEEACNSLYVVMGQARTTALKSACSKAIQLFNIQEDIQDEVERVNESVTKARAQRETLGVEMRKLLIQMMQLEAICLKRPSSL